jgi:cytochrome oxidase assembly protein ShyY1
VLRTALKPRWILALVLAMAIAAVFVLLSQWQFSRSRDAAPPPPAATERVRPLTGVFTPGVPMTAAVADQMVTMDGRFVQGTRVLISDRMQGERNGFWLVSAFEVEGSAGAGTRSEAVIPVVLGWIPRAGDAGDMRIPDSPAVVVGRLLPAEAPVAARPIQGQYPSLATAELVNVWDRESYAGFVVASSVTVDGAHLAPAAPLEPVRVGPQPQETPVNWLNIFYAVEWFVFAGFAFFIWWRLVADDHRRSLEEEQDNAQEPQIEQK